MSEFSENDFKTKLCFEIGSQNWKINPQNEPKTLKMAKIVWNNFFSVINFWVILYILTILVDFLSLKINKKLFPNQNIHMLGDKNTFKKIKLDHFLPFFGILAHFWDYFFNFWDQFPNKLMF